MLKTAIKTAFLFVGLHSIGAHANDAYSLRLTVARNDTVVVNTVTEMESGNQADLRIAASEDRDASSDANPDDDASIRILASVKEANSDHEAEINLQYFEKRQQSWLLIGEPSIIAALGQEASVALSADNPSQRGVEHLKFLVTVEKADNRPRHGDCCETKLTPQPAR